MSGSVPSAKETSMRNAELARDVLEELLGDTRIDSSRVNVTTTDGKVVLSGVVETFHEKWDAAEDASRVNGVQEVENDLAIDSAAERIHDAGLLDTATAGLDANSLVPRRAITITVSDGWITMTGNVRHYFQRGAAEHVIRHLPGIYGFTNLVTVDQDPAQDVSARIDAALRRNAAVDAGRINVTDAGGVVSLTGTVRTFTEKQEVENAARRAPGVVAIRNELVITD
jgi:osmotically-inducible protein OsmY